MIGECFGFLFYFQCTVKEPPKTTVVVCPPLVELRPDVQKRAAGELKSLGKGSALGEFAAKAIQQRDLVRACHRAKAKAKS